MENKKFVDRFFTKDEEGYEPAEEVKEAEEVEEVEELIEEEKEEETFETIKIKMKVKPNVRLNVRDGVNGEIKRVLALGEEVEVLEDLGDWVRIGSEEYVMKEFLK